MAKIPKIKKRGVSMRSRAARRETSPSLNLDKSLTSSKPPTETYEYSKPAVLAAHNAGISKKKKPKQMSRQQRLRHQKGLERADVNVGKLEKKVTKSTAKSKRIKERAAAWEDLNGNIAGSTAKGHPVVAQEAVDEPTEDTDLGATAVETPIPVLPAIPVEKNTQSLVQSADDLDEIF
ncbi:hypothetical protein LTR66_003247 [Elasticomyces elasticus]|nr:hypothetical protein LTR66_003247 [Elasticomyces elasticus]